MPITVDARRDRKAARARRDRPIYPERTPHPTLDRVTRRAARSRARLRGRNPFLLATSVVRCFSEVRATGLAAEMVYFLVLSLLPLVTAIGAGLGLLGAVLPAEKLQAMREGARGWSSSCSDASSRGRSPCRCSTTSWRSSRWPSPSPAPSSRCCWAAACSARRSGRSARPCRSPSDAASGAWGALLLTVLAVVTATAVLSLVVVGPLFGGGEAIAELVGAGALVSWTWPLGRWPVAVIVAWAFLVLLYRMGQRERGWRRVMLGAAHATVALLVLTSGFRLYLSVAPPGGAQLASLDDAASAAGLFVVTSLAVLLYAWLSALIILGGGIVNVEWAAARLEPEPAGEPEPVGQPQPLRP